MFSAFSTCVSWFDPTIVSRLIDDAQVGRSRDYLVIIYFFSDNLDFEFLKNMSPVPIPVTDFWSPSLIYTFIYKYLYQFYYDVLLTFVDVLFLSKTRKPIFTRCN
jgi:hypothetical protein